MKKNESDIEDVLEHSLPSVSAEEMESARERIFNYVQSDAAADRNPVSDDVDFNHARGWRWQPLTAMAAVAALLVAAIWIGLGWKARSVYARLETAEGSVSRISKGKAIPVRAGERIEAQEIVRSGSEGSTLVLADGSRVEMRAQSELVLERANDGVSIRLNNGDVIVNASKQHGHLYVQTRDLKVSVVGTVFLVNADDKGSRVAVIEGEVRVQQGTEERSLRPGEQLASNPKSENLEFFIETGWSREAFAYLSKLHESMAQSLAARQSSGQSTSVSGKAKFEEASIRPCEKDIQAAAGARGGGSDSIRISPGRLDAVCVTLPTLIRTAFRPLNNNSAFPGEPPAMHTLRMDSTYGLGMEDGTRVRGGPDWVRSDKYTIAAVGEGSASAATLQGPMLMELLERRFQLKVHVDVEQIPVYALTVAPGGLKMKPVARGSCVMELPSYIRQRDGGGTAIDPAARQRQSEEYRRGATPRECVGSSYTSGPNVMHVGGEVSISSLVERLQGMAYTTEGLDDRLVLDRTGIPDSERFTLVLEYAAVRSEYSEPMRPGEENIPKGPSIFAALEKLGLHLEKSKASREFIVIEHIERPSPN